MVIDLKVFRSVLYILAVLIFCSPLQAALPTDPCGCDPTLLQRADSGDFNMQSYVAKLYRTGEDGVELNYELARYWYQRIVDHKQADAKIKAFANLQLGLMYNSGKGGKQSYTSAMKCFKIAAKQGYYDAHVVIGQLYLEGHGVKKNYDKALYWWKIAAKNHQPQAQNLIFFLEKKLGEETAANRTITTSTNNKS